MNESFIFHLQQDESESELCKYRQNEMHVFMYYGQFRAAKEPEIEDLFSVKAF